MSDRYPGGVISATAVVPTPSSASGIWTLDQQEQAQKAGTWPFGGPFVYIEDVFSTYLYDGVGGAVSINNGIDLAGKGGMVWAKARTRSGGTAVYGAGCHVLYDTNRGINSAIASNLTDGQNTTSGHLTAFNSNGFSLAGNWEPNTYQAPYVSWTFRKQPKFFDVVTYTGDGSSALNISHNLGAVPGCIIVKHTNAADSWAVYHRSVGNTGALLLNSTAATDTASVYWNNTTPTSTQFTVGSSGRVNDLGGTYVAYLFAHNAGGFGLTGTDNVISCGSFTTGTNRNFSVNLGYEPQYILAKRTDSVEDWQVVDNMRGWSQTGLNILNPSNSNSESNNTPPYLVYITPTGFEQTGTSGMFNGTYIYIAIRRGPMKTPTDATTVFTPTAWTGSSGDKSMGVPQSWLGGFFAWLKNRETTQHSGVFDTLRGFKNYFWVPPGLDGGTSATGGDGGDDGGGFGYSTSYLALKNGSYWGAGGDGTGKGYIGYIFRRAPGFFDEVCYTGTGSNTTQTHNLGAVPELMIVKQRNVSGNEWMVYSAATGNTKYLYFPGTTAAQTDSRFWNNTTPTSSVFSIGTYSGVNLSGSTYVAYLFATCAGVSKVGSYTGTGATQTISCGFTGGARFVLIKRTDSTGDWYVWDTARGMVSGTDPSLLLNSAAAEVNANSIYTTTGGFQIVSTAAGINASGGTFIFLAIA